MSMQYRFQGLEQTTFTMIEPTTGCSLVSDGAECILINKKFFLHHLTDEVAKKIRKTVSYIYILDQNIMCFYNQMTGEMTATFTAQIVKKKKPATDYYL